MKKGKYQAEAQRDRKTVIVLLIVVVLLLAAVIVLVANRPQKRQAKLPNGVDPSGRSDRLFFPGISRRCDSRLR